MGGSAAAGSVWLSIFCPSGGDTGATERCHHRAGIWAHNAPRASPANFFCAALVDESGVADGTAPVTAILFLADIARGRIISDIMIQFYPNSDKYEIRVKSQNGLSRTTVIKIWILDIDTNSIQNASEITWSISECTMQLFIVKPLIGVAEKGSKASHTS